MELCARIAATSLVLLGLTGCTAAQPKPLERVAAPAQAQKPSAAAGAYRDRATARLFAEGDYRGAIDDFSFAIGFAPADAGLYVGRGVAYLKIGNRKAAKDDFDKAASLDGTLEPSLASLLESRGAAVLDGPREGVKP